MSESIVDVDSRRTTTALYRCPADIFDALPIDGPLPAAGTEQAKQLNAWLRPRYFALLGHAIDSILDRGLESDIAPKRKLQLNTFGRLRKDVMGHLDSAYLPFSEDPQQRATREAIDHLLEVRGKVTGVKITRARAILGGIETASNNSIAALKMFNTAAKPLDLADKETVLRSSYGTLINLASMGIVHLSMINTALSNRTSPRVVLADNATHFTFESPLQDTELTDTMRSVAADWGSAHIGATTVREVVDTNNIIGCPVLLRPGQVKRFWNWTVDQAVERGLVG